MVDRSRLQQRHLVRFAIHGGISLPPAEPHCKACLVPCCGQGRRSTRGAGNCPTSRAGIAATMTKASSGGTIPVPALYNCTPGTSVADSRRVVRDVGNVGTMWTPLRL